jgi:hypothetical protein
MPKTSSPDDGGGEEVDDLVVVDARLGLELVQVLLHQAKHQPAKLKKWYIRYTEENRQRQVLTLEMCFIVKL